MATILRGFASLAILAILSTPASGWCVAPAVVRSLFDGGLRSACDLAWHLQIWAWLLAG